MFMLHTVLYSRRLQVTLRPQGGDLHSMKSQLIGYGGKSANIRESYVPMMQLTSSQCGS